MAMKAVKLAGSSMLPLFRDGGTALYEPHPGKTVLVPGDCAVYRYGGETLLHRVTGVRADGVFFSNDDALEPHFVKREDILGRVETRNPLKKGLTGLCFHKITRILRKAKCVLKRN